MKKILLLVLLLLILFVVNASAYTSPVPMDSWNLDDLGGNVINTTSFTKDHDLSLVGDAGGILFSPQNAYGFYTELEEGANFPNKSAYYSVNNNDFFNFNQSMPFTIEMWFRTSEDITNQQVLINKGQLGSWNCGFLVRIMNNKMYFCTKGGCDVPNDIASSANLKINHTYHMVFVHNAAADGVGNSSIWINGTIDNSAIKNSPSNSSLRETMYIGARWHAATNFLEGQIYYATIYDKALNQTTIANLYSSHSQYSQYSPPPPAEENRTGNVTGWGLANYIAIWNANYNITHDTNLYWDFANNRLGIRTTTPAHALDVNGDVSADSFIGDGSALTGISTGAAAPNYDSGWVNISQSESKWITHNTGGDVDDYIVDVSAKSATYGVNQINYGTRQLSYGTAGYRWENLNTTKIKVLRTSNDVSAEQIRVRIWKY